MKKLVALILLVGCMAGCSSTKSAVQTDHPECIRIKEYLDANYIDSSDILVYLNSNDVLTIAITYEDYDLTFWGNAIFDVKNMCDELVGLDDYRLSLCLKQGGEIAMMFHNSIGAYGNITDHQSDEGSITIVNSVDDLIGAFPASLLHIKGQQLDQNDMKIYNEVMAALDADYLTPEDEIYSSLAPEYGMTPDELKAFMDNMLEQIYSN